MGSHTHKTREGRQEDRPCPVFPKSTNRSDKHPHTHTNTTRPRRLPHSAKDKSCGLPEQREQGSFLCVICILIGMQKGRVVRRRGVEGLFVHLVSFLHFRRHISKNSFRHIFHVGILQTSKYIFSSGKNFTFTDTLPENEANIPNKTYIRKVLSILCLSPSTE